MRNSRDHLFSSAPLYEVLQARDQKMLAEIDQISSNALLNTPTPDLADQLSAKYRLDPLVIRDDLVEADQAEMQIDVSRDPNRLAYHFESSPALVAGTRITYYVPFEGDFDLFRWQPSTHQLPGPTGKVRGSEVLLEYETTNHHARSIIADFTRELANLNQEVEYLRRDLDPYNARLGTLAAQRIEARKHKLLSDQGLVSSLGVPLRRRAGAPQTYAVPTVKRKVAPVRTAPSGGAYKPEPTLPTAEYDHILNVVSNMVTVMERSPRAFRGMKEEVLRTHFLVQLNAQYEGQATGETFNASGKTDILIRHEGQNIFIAECKLWTGAKALQAAIDQLLDYVTWRDTKTAILVFNRNRDFSAVLEQISETVRAHENAKREIPYQHESGYRFVLHQRKDVDREIYLTVLAFDIPS